MIYIYQAKLRYSLAMINVCQTYPWYSLTEIYVYQTIPRVQFGYDLSTPNHTPDNVNIWYGLAVTPGEQNRCSFQYAISV